MVYMKSRYTAKRAVKKVGDTESEMKAAGFEEVGRTVAQEDIDLITVESDPETGDATVEIATIEAGPVNEEEVAEAKADLERDQISLEPLEAPVSVEEGTQEAAEAPNASEDDADGESEPTAAEEPSKKPTKRAKKK